ncbi:MAG: (deoxy)nucleoside triphosphate pyrophosphohydrolase [Myxococcota bacterium]
MIVVAAAIVWSDGRILLTRRPSGTHLEGMWEFPGGKLEDGEAPEEALVRECEEECAIQIAVRDILDVTFHRYPKKDVLLLFYDCTLVSGEVQHREVADHVWCAPAEIRSYPLPPPDERVVQKIERRGSSLDTGQG